LTSVCLTLGALQPAQAHDAATMSRGTCPTSNDALNTLRGTQSTERCAAVVPEVWYRIYLSELDHGRWRSAGTFENPNRENCLRYGRGWVEGGTPGTRKFTGPVPFNR
jgi:hypothetical protein